MPGRPRYGGREVSRAVGAAVRILRQDAGISPPLMAHMIGMSTSSLSRMETGDRNITVDQLVAVAAAFGVEPAKLLDPDSLRVNRAQRLRDLADAIEAGSD